MEVPMKPIEKAVTAGIRISGITRLVSSFTSKCLTILAYHHIYNNYHHRKQEVTNHLFLGLREFTEHLIFLKENYCPVGVGDVAAWLAGSGKLPDRPVLLTFDDGYRGFYRDVYPVLKRSKIPALVTLITGWVDREITPWDVLINRGVNRAFTNRLVLRMNGEEMVLALDSLERKRKAFMFLSHLYESSNATYRERLLDSLTEAAPWITEDDGVLESLNWDETREMADNGIDFGCHTYSHAILTGLNPVEVREEVLRSKKRLMDELPLEDMAFAYPAGRYDSEVVEQVEDVGFLFSMSSDGMLVKGDEPLHSLPRIGIRYDDTMTSLFFKLSGLRAAAMRARDILSLKGVGRMMGKV
jgi:peptidoglycan/xylan/chitin deacetylase (PgdA/CDA1 family)